MKRVQITGLPKEEGWPAADQVLALCRTRPGYPVTFQVRLSPAACQLTALIPSPTDRVPSLFQT